MRELIKQAPSVEEAVELAIAEMGLSIDQVTWEVLEMPKKSLFFKKPAKVRVTQIEDEFDVRSLLAEPEREEKKEETPAPEKTEKKEQPVKANKPENKESEKKNPEKKETEKKKPQDNKPEKAVKKAAAEKEEEPAAPAAVQEVIAESERSPKLAYAVEYVKTLIKEFNPGEYTITTYKTEKGSVIKLDGEDVGALIGRKGETMEAISYLTGLAANRISDDGEKVTVDIANYRRKREKDLVQSSKKAAAKVLKTGRPFSFEPMNPYDRRIIHSTVGEIEGVKSESKGEGSNRRVVIYSTSAKSSKSERTDRNDRKSSSNRRDRDRKGSSKPRTEKKEAPATKTKEEKLVDVPSFGLYSKISIDED